MCKQHKAYQDKVNQGLKNDMFESLPQIAMNGPKLNSKDLLVTEQCTIVSQPSKCLKFITFRGDVLLYATECKYLSEALETFYDH